MKPDKNVDYEEIAKRLNEKLSDEKFLNQFLNDIVSSLKSEGIMLSTDQEKAIRESVGKYISQFPIDAVQPIVLP